jgi:hypothetical protein
MVIEIQVLGPEEGYSLRNGWRFALYVKLLGPIASIGLNFFKRPTPGPDIYGFLMMVHYHAVFMSQGIVDGLYAKQIHKHAKNCKSSPILPFIGLGTIVLYSFTSPMAYDDIGFIFFYPLYTDMLLKCSFTTGTWLWIYMIFFLS